MKRIAAGFVLLARLLAAIMRSGWYVSWRILRPAGSLAPGFAEYAFRPMGPGATTMLACLICLTPGTTAVDIDATAGRIRLHLLDAGNGAAQAALQEIRELFEGPVRTLFAEEEMA